MFINRLSEYDVNENLEHSNTSNVEKVKIKENSMSFVVKYEEREEHDYLCFVLGYN